LAVERGDWNDESVTAFSFGGVSMDDFLVTAKDRRAVRRLAHIGCEVVRERDFRRVSYRVLDLSAEGMQVVADSSVLTGESMIVSFRIPKSDAFVDAEATVARVIHGRRPSDRHAAIGLRFGSIHRDVRGELATALRKLPPTLPARALRIDYAATIRRLEFPALLGR
jgi:hypothetical protein